MRAPEVRAWCVAHGIDPARVLALLPYPGSDGGRYTLIEYDGPIERESRTVASWPPLSGWPAEAVASVERLRRERTELERLIREARRAHSSEAPPE